MKFKLEFDMDNDAFYSYPDKLPNYDEPRRILEAIGWSVWSGEAEGTIKDINGNKVGEWEILDNES